jgi:hypothetical protein
MHHFYNKHQVEHTDENVDDLMLMILTRQIKYKIIFEIYEIT